MHLACPASLLRPRLDRDAPSLGLLGLAAAMGIGRFAFTPLLPLMQASARPDAGRRRLARRRQLPRLPRRCARAVSALRRRRARRRVSACSPSRCSTLAMGLVAIRSCSGSRCACWPAWPARSCWSASSPGPAARSRVGESTGVAGWVFAGVGIGIALAGLVGARRRRLRSGAPRQPGWSLGAIARAASRARAGARCCAPRRRGRCAARRRCAARSHRRWRLVACYGAFGFGYIMPATFLPAAARELFADPARLRLDLAGCSASPRRRRRSSRRTLFRRIDAAPRLGREPARHGARRARAGAVAQRASRCSSARSASAAPSWC